jgi:hypothetical protein
VHALVVVQVLHRTQQVVEDINLAAAAAAATAAAAAVT